MEFVAFHHALDDKDFPWQVLQLVIPDRPKKGEKPAPSEGLPTTKVIYRSSVWGSAFGWFMLEAERSARVLKRGAR